MTRRERSSGRLEQDSPEYWEHQRERAVALRAELEEADRPKTVSFRLAWDAHMAVEEALRLATQYTGTTRRARALEHVCTEYLSCGPHARAVESISAKHAAREARLEDLMKEAGPARVTELFKKLFPGRRSCPK